MRIKGVQGVRDGSGWQRVGMEPFHSSYNKKMVEKASTLNIVKEGWLYKQSKYLKEWRKYKRMTMT